MSDVCLIYAKEDSIFASKLYDILAERWDVWWDDKIVGRFAIAIEKELPGARCIVPIFSASSRSKDTFTDELRLAQKHGIELIPVRIDDSLPPYSFGSYSNIPLLSWSGQADHPGILQLQRRIHSIVPARMHPKRPAAIEAGKLPLPAYFFSVSSHETQVIPNEALQSLRIFGAPQMLVSAYDLVARRKPQALLRELAKYREAGGFVLLDSGNYEASRLGTRRWKPDDLKGVMAQAPHDWAFCFDVMDPSRTAEKAVEEILAAVERDSKHTGAPVLPIVHAPRLKKGGYDLTHTPAILKEIANELTPRAIAIAERELGGGIIARARTVHAIREKLNELPFYQPLHLLGSGNPWTVAVLAAAGADTFDGLEWCRVVIDSGGDADRTNHFQHFDFFEDQQAGSAILDSILQEANVGFGAKVLFHNLEYFTGFSSYMQDMFKADSIEAFVNNILGKKPTNKLKLQIPGIFK